MLDLDRVTATAVLAALRAREVTSAQLVDRYFERIARYAVINAVRSINPLAREEAAASDARRQAGHARVLEGLPILLKDNLDTADLPTTAGSIALARHRPRADAPVVARLREAGAIVLGKVNLSEFANFLTYSMPNGYSSLGGQVLNPYDLQFDISGSSSGSAAAMAAGLAAATIGTETSGSILCPAAAASVVGLKPTVGLVPGQGIVPIASTQDTAGPMTRDVRDAALLLEVMAGGSGDYVAAADAGVAGLAGARLAVVGPDAETGVDWAGSAATGDQSAREAYVAALHALSAAGAELVEVEVAAVTAPLVLYYEFKRDLNAYLGPYAGTGIPSSLADVIAFYRAHPEAGLRYGMALLTESEALDLDAEAATYQQNLVVGLAQSRSALDDVLRTHGALAIVSPNTLWHLSGRAGYPGIAVPAGYTAHGRRPCTVSFTGTAGSEAVLLRCASGFEQIAHPWRPPVEQNPGLLAHGKPTV
ncbi:amidase [Micrococcales bacterium 31B]|nr:amidase [Micrococcales bacterium 31B]